MGEATMHEHVGKHLPPTEFRGLPGVQRKHIVKRQRAPGWVKAKGQTPRLEHHLDKEDEGIYYKQVSYNYRYLLETAWPEISHFTKIN